MLKNIFEQSTDKAVAASAVVIGSMQTAEIEILSVQLQNTGANPLTAFSFLGRVSLSAPYAAIKSAAFLTLDSTSIAATVEPATLAAGATAFLLLDVTGYSDIQFKATSALGTNVQMFCGGVKK